MTRPLLRTALLGAALIGAGAGAAEARADGLPVVGVDAGPGGVPAEGGEVRYVTLPARGGTVVARVERRDGLVPGSTFLRGRFVVPVVAYDGSAGGLSADGRTLVLLRPRVRFPRARTTLAVIDPQRLRLRKLLVLRGDFSFDALSPDGRWLYLIQYPSPRDVTRYSVRAYDVRAGHLLARPIVDPDEWTAVMRGSPITRRTSPDGRWAYTLYDGAGMAPFVHALDTRNRRAVCIDLPTLAGRGDLFTLRLGGGDGGSGLTVTKRGRALAVIDTHSFRVSKPPAVVAPSTGAGRPWLVPVLASAGGLLAALAVGLTLRRWRRPGAVAAQRAA
jgi:hypothetical protein